MIKLRQNVVFFMIRSIKNQQVKLRLPSFSHYPLHQDVVKYLQQKQLHTPTFIQYALMAKLYAGNWKLANRSLYHIVSPTGSGKTLSYMLPIVNHLKKEEVDSKEQLTKSERPRALVLTSNKQLVVQARQVGKDICHFAKLKCQGLGIGRSLQQEKQKLSQGVDILVSGYSRFKRMLDRRQAYLSNLTWVVVDEIDTLFQSQKSMVQQMFQSIVLPKYHKQNSPNFIFSSTTNPTPLRQYLFKKLPNLEQIIDKNTHINLQNIKHQFLYCSSQDKHEPLLEQLKRQKKSKIMIFCNTVKSLHQLQYFMNSQGIQTFSLHSQLTKQSRIRNYTQFRDSEKGIMLSTDLGSRGLHFPKLQKVINYDFPLSTCDYLQRAGRTGRAGQKGKVVSLYFKKHLPIINQLKDASFKTPLKISNSAYGLRNRQQTRRPSKFVKK